MKGLKKRVVQGETLIGCWLNIGSAITAEIVGLSGYDWVLIDLEHGSGGETNLLHQLQALEHTPTTVIVRVESNESVRVTRVLDLGVEGVMVPRILNEGEAKEVAKAWQYPPKGIRGMAKMTRATKYGSDFQSYYERYSNEILGLIQIETLEVLDHLDEVAAIDGVDVLFIGPADLSLSMGIFGQLDHPRFIDAVKATVKAAQKAGKATGILLFNPDDFKFYQELGITFIACGADATFVSDGAREMAKKLDSIRGGKGSKNHTNS